MGHGEDDMAAISVTVTRPDSESYLTSDGVAEMGRGRIRIQIDVSSSSLGGSVFCASMSAASRQTPVARTLSRVGEVR